MKPLLFTPLVAVLALIAGPAFGQDKDYAKPIIDKAVKAVGSSETQTKYAGFTCDSEADLTINDVKIGLSASWSVQGVGHYRSDFSLNLPNGASVSIIAAISSAQNWMQNQQDNKVQDIPDLVLPALKVDLRAVRLAQRPVYLRDKKYKLSPLGEMKIDGKETVGVKVAQKGHPDIDLYFDKTNGLPVKCSSRVVENKNGVEAIHSFTFSDYKKIDGVQHFTRIRFRRDNEQIIDMRLSNIQLNEDLGKGLFKRP